MSDNLARRFGWWWHHPAEALRHAFPEKSSDDAILRYVWPAYQQAAFNYELASRADGSKKPSYLLRKRFDQLTTQQMWLVARIWPRKCRPLRPFQRLPYGAEPSYVRALHALGGSEPVTLSSIPKKFLSDPKFVMVPKALESRAQKSRAYRND